MSEPKKLTEAPMNFKEAIDWVLSLGEKDKSSVINDSYVTMSLRYILNEATEMKDFYDKMNKDVSSPVVRLAYALQKFIGYQWVEESDSYKWKIGENGIVQKDSSYNSTYGSSKWHNDIHSADYDGSKRRSGVHSFFTAIAFIYEGLTELFFKCKTEWSEKSLNGNSSDALHKFMTTNGFSDTQLNTNMKGDEITSQAFQSLTEFTTAYNSAGQEPSLDTFRSQLEQNAMSNPSESPLSALYLLATYA
ncbi:variant erythrocyte surface antigen-1 family protein [Babesia caballi]|uniref:Variant erythrocyte surface antigen-1 family protein n=1 Tax=Babesia caballi TaxID=5871 RepID=A0AAV4LTA0_BABCB|nr:variant erythrocyte surface antigen-1 family protein [Babesia caballi]